MTVEIMSREPLAVVNQTSEAICRALDEISDNPQRLSNIDLSGYNVRLLVDDPKRTKLYKTPSTKKSGAGFGVAFTSISGVVLTSGMTESIIAPIGLAVLGTAGILTAIKHLPSYSFKDDYGCIVAEEIRILTGCDFWTGAAENKRISQLIAHSRHSLDADSYYEVPLGLLLDGTFAGYSLVLLRDSIYLVETDNSLESASPKELKKIFRYTKNNLKRDLYDAKWKQKRIAKAQQKSHRLP